MKRTIILSMMVLMMCGLLTAGTLEPAGPPAPTMKTLDEVEARIPIKPVDMPITLANAGSYYLTGNFTATSAAHSIFVSTEYVTVDLNGYTLNGGSVGTDAIQIDAGIKYTTIRNGYIVNWTGIAVNGEESTETFIEKIHVKTITNEGVFLGDNSSATDSTVSNCNIGFQLGQNCTVSQCTSQANTNDGFNSGDSCTYSKCFSKDNGRSGIVSGNNTKISDSEASNNGTAATVNIYGIQVGYSSIIKNCIVCCNGTGITIPSLVYVSGIGASYGSKINGNVVHENGKDSTKAYVYGIRAGNLNIISGNTISSNGYSARAVKGLYVLGSNLITENSCSNNGIMAQENVDGMNIGDGSTVIGNALASNGNQAGGVVYGMIVSSNCLIDQNTASGNGVGAGLATNMTLGVSGCVYGNNVAP